MRIAFFDAISWDYVIESAWQGPLGGTQSGLCYLAAELADRGHEVFLINQCQQAQFSRGVRCIPMQGVLNAATLQSFDLDAMVIIGSARNGAVIKPLLSPKTKVILWSGHAADQPSVVSLKEKHFRNGFDGYALVSEWQRQTYHYDLGVPLESSEVRRNAIAPGFEKRHPPGTPILDSKKEPPILAYTSTPFRGLDLLVEAFPALRREVPGLVLKVYSSMKVYRMDESQEAREFGALYERCRTTEGIDYVGAIPQPQLVDALAEVSVLAYPNTYPETSCIAVMEAMASGCQVVTSRLGALPETTAGHARLVGVHQGGERFVQDFQACVLEALKARRSSQTESNLRDQIDFTAEHYTWGPRAEEWVEWIARMQAADQPFLRLAQSS